MQPGHIGLGILLEMELAALTGDAREDGLPIIAPLYVRGVFSSTLFPQRIFARIYHSPMCPFSDGMALQFLATQIETF
jgi:hypothetical protein